MKNSLRFFVTPEVLQTDAICLNDRDLAHQLSRVLRLGPGARVLLLDGHGMACEVELLALERDKVRGIVRQRLVASGEPALHLSIYLALIRPERFEWALQKCVELGAARLVPVACARSLPSDRADQRRIERWQRILREAAEQACRGLLPTIEPPISFAAACARVATTALPIILWEQEAPALRDRLPGTPPATCALLSGPEGGITPEELTLAQAHGIMPASLGPRILRAETAPVAAAALLIGLLG